MTPLHNESQLMRLPEQSDSSSEEGSPRKRPRHDNNDDQDHNDDNHEEPEVVEETMVQQLPQKSDWDHFVRSGAKLKSIAETAMAVLEQRVNSNAIAKNLNNNNNSNDTFHENLSNADKDTSPQIPQMHTNASQIAREKTTECMILEKKLKESEAHGSALLATNSSLREAVKASNDRMERTVEALRIAGTNATNARADADAAEAYAASLAHQLERLRHVVEDTKRATKVLHDEHEQIAASARSVEAKLLQRETEFAHLLKERTALFKAQESFKHVEHDLIQDKKQLELQLERKNEHIKNLSREVQERDALEKARRDRSSMVEKELRESRALLLDASSTAVETESTMSSLKETIQALQTENKSLHTKIEEIQERACEKEARLQDTLSKAEKDSQELRVRSSSHDEQVQRITYEKEGCEKQITQLKTRIGNLERRLRDTVSFMSPPPAAAAAASTIHQSNSTQFVSGMSSRKSFAIPPLTPAGSDQTPGSKASVSKTTTTKSATGCCICYKPGSGLMKSCQCGKRDCEMRAHSSCLGNQNKSQFSVSFPGTPSPRLPVVLCGSVAKT